MLASLVVFASAFTPLAPVPAAPALAVAGRTAAPCASLSSRRSAIGAGASVVAALAMAPRSAFADDEEDGLARIVAKNQAALAAEREAKSEKIKRNVGKVERENAGANVLVLGIGAAGFVFSLPFFYKNLARLFLRFRSVVDSSVKQEDFDKNIRR
jgi:hypothetical protein